MSEIHLPSETRIIGVDLGLNGAISLVSSDMCVISVKDMPVYKTVINKQARTKLCISECLSVVRDMIDQGAAALVIEDVHAMGVATGVNAAFSMGYSRAVFESIAVMLDINLIVVAPSTWKRQFGLIKTEKQDSVEKAKQILSDSHKYLTRKKDHNRAESMLIAAHLLRDVRQGAASI